MSRKRKHLDEETEPTVKLISDGDLLVERLLKKQLSKQSNLQAELQREQVFISSAEYKPLTDYISGINSLNKLEKTSEYIRKLEEFTAAGLCKEDVDFYMDREKGLEYFNFKHKNLDPQIVEKRLSTINDFLFKYHKSKNSEESPSTYSRLHSECMLSSKPNSVETNLLKFALDNERKYENIPTKVEPIKIVEKDFMNSINDGLDVNVNITKLQKKVQRRLRAMSNRIDSKALPLGQNPIEAHKPSALENSKWDLKYDNSEPIRIQQNMIQHKIQDPSTEFKCSDTKISESSTSKSGMSGNRYTIRNGTIIKMENLIDYSSCKKLSMEEIKNMPKFSQYNPGQPSKILYLKNTHSLTEIDLKLLFEAFNFQTKAVNVMKGRMKGQAFVEMENCKLAEEALTLINGIIVKNKPVIIQFSTKSELP